VREAVAAFGRGECFVERYLDKPRHVETQVLADTHGNVVVVSTRDCSLQRRYQKVVEEAPAPFLSQEQLDQLYQASKDIIREAEYVGAGRASSSSGGRSHQLPRGEHPPAGRAPGHEEVTGVDLVREQFRIADGLELTFTDPVPRGHSFGSASRRGPGPRASCRRPAPVTGSSAQRVPASASTPAWSPAPSSAARSTRCSPSSSSPAPPGRRRSSAAARALDEMQVEGMATLLPFHRKVGARRALHQRARSPGTTAGSRPSSTTTSRRTAARGGRGAEPREKVVVEVGWSRPRGPLPAGLGASGGGGGGGAKKGAPKRSAKKAGGAAASGDSLTSPMQGTIVKVAVEDGATVEAGDLVVVLEAMKMEQPINAHKAGTVSALTAAVGEVVTSGATICEIKD
jgi:acetyl-CoA/propionyl-CoA carboxylase biotin carboxyl carrier protein